MVLGKKLGYEEAVDTVLGKREELLQGAKLNWSVYTSKRLKADIEKAAARAGLTRTRYVEQILLYGHQRAKEEMDAAKLP